MRRWNRGPGFACAFFLLLTSAACSSPPQQKPAPPATLEEMKESMPWRPPEPKQDGFDWIMLKSGEWLKGEIVVLRNGGLEFESDELDTLNLDWVDVKELRSPRQTSLLFKGRRAATGTVLIRDDVVVVGVGDEIEQYDRKDLLVVIPGGLTERNFWSGKVSVGFVGRTGNVETTDASAYLFVRRRTLSNRLEASYTGNYGTVSEVQTVNNHRFTGKFDLFIGDKWFITIPNIDLYRDSFKNIDVQVTPALLIGYHAVDRPGLEWDVQVGGGYRYTEYISVEEGADTSGTTANLLAGTDIDWDITSDIELKVVYWVHLGVPDTANTNQHAEIRFSIDLYKDFDLDIAWIWEYVGQPAAESDGTVPKKDDYMLSVGIGWEF